MLSGLFPLLCTRGKWDTGRWSNCSKIKLLRMVRASPEARSLWHQSFSTLVLLHIEHLAYIHSQLQFNISPSPLYVRPHVLLLFQKIWLSFFLKKNPWSQKIQCSGNTFYNFIIWTKLFVTSNGPSVYEKCFLGENDLSMYLVWWVIEYDKHLW